MKLHQEQQQHQQQQRDGKNDKISSQLKTTVTGRDLFVPVLQYLRDGPRLCVRVRVNDPTLSELVLDIGPKDVETERLMDWIRDRDDDDQMEEEKEEQEEHEGNKKRRNDDDKFSAFVTRLCQTVAKNDTISTLRVTESFLPYPSGLTDSTATIHRLLLHVPYLPALQHLTIDSPYLAIELPRLTDTILSSSQQEWLTLRLDVKVHCRSQQQMNHFASALFDTCRETLQVFHIGGLCFTPLVAAMTTADHYCYGNTTTATVQLDPLWRVLACMRQLKEIVIGAWLSPRSTTTHSVHHCFHPQSLAGVCHLPRLKQLALIALDMDDRHLQVLSAELSSSSAAASCKNKSGLQTLILVSNRMYSCQGMQRVCDLAERNCAVQQAALAFAGGDTTSWPHGRELERQQTYLRLLCRLNGAGRSACLAPTAEEQQQQEEEANDVTDRTTRSGSSSSSGNNMSEAILDFVVAVGTTMEFESEEMRLTALWHVFQLHGVEIIHALRRRTS